MTKKTVKKTKTKTKKTAKPKALNRNPIGLNGIEFVEFSTSKPQELRHLFRDFGFSRVMMHRIRDAELFVQGDIRFILNDEPGSFAANFAESHGPCIASMGWRVKNAQKAFELAVKRGATPAQKVDYFDRDGQAIPAIYGIGQSLIYFVEKPSADLYKHMGFVAHPTPELVPSKGFEAIDHLTNNVHKGTMKQWADFYKKIFGFTEVRYFDIRGAKTGLTSYALRSPCGKFCIPINEASEKKSQINEYLEEYKGPGIQHLAFLTNDILKSLKSLEGTEIETLDIDPEYYDEVFERLPQVTENRKMLRKYQVLIDGDKKGYLLQLFTKNLVGPIFIEIIQRKNHLSFGEGNFGALFKSIERDQMRRGVL